MGLSKKLGVTPQKGASAVSYAVPYKWSHQTYTMEEIMKKFKLPCVVQCVTDSCTVVWANFQFDLRQPLLLYSKRSVRKMHAVSLRQDTKTKEVLEEIGPPLAIPEDYEGWFGATPKGVNKIKRHLRVESVANSTTRRFLVTTKCPAFTSCHKGDGDLDYVPHDVMPGEILRRVCVMDGDPNDPDVPKLVRDHGPCLECLDEKDEAVVIPLSHRAVIYEISETYPDDGERVFQISGPINAGNSKLPRIFTLVHGEPPMLAYAFTGMMRCYSVFTEETILAATLDDPTSMCLELGTDSCAKFRLGLNETAIKKTCEFNNANQKCESFGPKFLPYIKVSFSLKPEPSELDDIDLSFYDSVSDMQETDATSEFEIDWGSVKKPKLQTSPREDKKEDGSIEDLTALDEQSQNSKAASHALKLDQLPQRKDFTELELADLMLRKDLGGRSKPGAAKKANEARLRSDERVTDNPLFYYFQSNPDENSCTSSSAENLSSGDDTLTRDKSGEHGGRENPIVHLLQQNADQEGNDDVEDTKSSGQETVLDSSQYNQVVCKAAKEYSEIDSSLDSDSEGDDDSDKQSVICFNNLGSDVQAEKKEEKSSPVDMLSPKSEGFSPHDHASIAFTFTYAQVVDSTDTSGIGDLSAGSVMSLSEHESIDFPTIVESPDAAENDTYSVPLFKFSSKDVRLAKVPIQNDLNADEAVERLNNLIKEVSDIVKTPDNDVRCETKQEISQCENQTVQKSSGEQSEGAPSTTYNLPDAQQINSRSHDNQIQGAKLIKSKDAKVESSVNVNNNTGLTDSTTNLISNDFNGSGRRSESETNLASSDENAEENFLVGARKLLRKFAPGSTTGSTTTTEKEGKNRFDSSKVTHYPHKHPHKAHDTKSSSHGGQRDNDDPNPHSSFFDGDHSSPLQRHARITRSKVLASVQSFERLGSATSSMTSNSSIGSKGCKTKIVSLATSSQTAPPRQEQNELLLSETVHLDSSQNQELTPDMADCHASKSDTSEAHDDNIVNDSEEETVTFEEYFTISELMHIQPAPDEMAVSTSTLRSQK